MKQIKKFLKIQILVLMLMPILTYGQREMINLGIGEDVPSTILIGIVDANFTSVDLAELSKKKLVIIDFWATWCAPCLSALPKLDSLRSRYIEGVEVLTVTNEDSDHVNRFLQKRRENGQYIWGAPKLFGDTILQQLFPHNIVPHYVWLKNGKVIAITEEVNQNAIEGALESGVVNLKMKVDHSKIDYDREHVTLSDFLQSSAFAMPIRKINYSLITPFIPELGYSGGYSSPVDSMGNRRITATNVNLISLYKVAYGKMRTFIGDAAIDIRSDDNLVRIFDVSGLEAHPIIEDNSFCYEVVAADSMVFQKMQQDLKFAMPQFRVNMVDARDTCIVLEKINDNIQGFVVDNTSGRSEFLLEGACYTMKNVTMDIFRTSLEGRIMPYGKYPIVNATEFNERFDLALCDFSSSIDVLNERLMPYGLKLTKKIANYTKLLIEDN